MKQCTLCKQEKPLSEYNKKASRPDGKQNVCRECNRARSKQYYAENQKKHIKNIAINRNKYREINQQYVINYLLQHPCAKCGETDIRALQFDHQNNKEENVSRAIAKPWSLKRLACEIDKCVVLCASCHFIKTSIEQNHFKHRYLVSKNLA